MVTKGSGEEGGGDFGKWWGREVVMKREVTLESGEEGKWWGREVVTKGSGEEGKHVFITISMIYDVITTTTVS